MYQDPEYKENLVLKVKIWSDFTCKQTVLKKRLVGLSVMGDSKIILFEADEVCVPKGFECSIQLQINESGCWYKELAQPISTTFASLTRRSGLS